MSSRHNRAFYGVPPNRTYDNNSDQPPQISINPPDNTIAPNIPSQGATQDITAGNITVPSELPPRGIVAQRLHEFLHSLPIGVALCPEQTIDATSYKNDDSSSSSDVFSSVSQHMPSPFHAAMQQRLNDIREHYDPSEALLVHSTPNPPFPPGVSRPPSVYVASALDSRRTTNHTQYRPIAITERSITTRQNTKQEYKHGSSKSQSSSDIWPPPPVLSTQLSSGKSSTYVSKHSAKNSTISRHSYYNTFSTRTLSPPRNAPLQVNLVPLVNPTNKDQRAKKLPTAPMYQPFRRREQCRQSGDQNSLFPIDTHSTPLIPVSSSSHTITSDQNQTALIPAHFSNHTSHTHSRSVNPATPALPPVPEIPQISYVKFLERYYGLKPESAAALIPAFQTPCCLWAEKVRRVLQARGFTNLDDPWLTFALLPFILGKLPSSIAQMAPTNNLSYLLDFIESYDRKTNNLHDVLIKTTTPTVKPSAAFLQKCTELRRARGPDLEDDAIRQLAWQALSTNLPSQLQSFVLTIKASNELPTPRQWEVIDNLWFDTLSKQELTTKLPVLAVASEGNKNNTKNKNTKRNNNVVNQLNQLSTKLDQTLAQITSSSTGAVKGSNPASKYVPRNPLIGKNFSLGIPLKDRGIDLSRYPNAPFPHRADFCFYHQAFGKEAIKCNPGCAWENKTGKPLRQLPVRVPDPTALPSTNPPPTDTQNIPKNV